MTVPVFKVGMRVRMKPEFRVLHPQMKSFTGTVFKVEDDEGPYLFVAVRRDGLSTKSHPSFTRVDKENPHWEPIPDLDLSLDEVGVTLARAVLSGDLTAAIPLADRVIELCGGTPRLGNVTGSVGSITEASG